MIDIDELASEVPEEVREILQSKMVRKYVAYRDLTEGIKALKDDDVLYEHLIRGVTERVRVKESTVDEVIKALVKEVESNTAALESAEEDQ